MQRFFILLTVVLVAILGYWWWQGQGDVTLNGEMIACPADARICPDGSAVGREGPECQFAACPAEPVPDDVQAQIDEKTENIVVTNPPAGSYIASPLQISGEARGTWFFEADFPVVLTDWDGLIIAEHFATAQGEWMTEDFVPFSSELEFDSPYNEGDPDFMQRGWLILQRDNPTDDPAFDDAVEIPVWFTPAASE